jgi:riboflavin biosynthesis pyrimidine reductase
VPRHGSPLTPAELIDLYAPASRAAQWLRVNFIQSIDGSSSVGGLSGALGGPADKAVFDILRGVADVVLAGAGTVRSEGYGALTVDGRLVEWRRRAGLPDHPVMAIVSRRLDLDPASALFTEAPTRPLVFTTSNAPSGARRELAEVATVIDAGAEEVEPRHVLAELERRGLPQVLCEGGPTLFGLLIAADAVDELCLTTAPLLEGGAGARIAAPRGEMAAPQEMELVSLLRSGAMLLARYARPAS